jgi:hypothetical protein
MAFENAADKGSVASAKASAGMVMTGLMVFPPMLRPPETRFPSPRSGVMSETRQGRGQIYGWPSLVYG